MEERKGEKKTEEERLGEERRLDMDKRQEE